LLKGRKISLVADLAEPVDRLFTHRHLIVGQSGGGEDLSRYCTAAVGELGDRREAYPGVAVRQGELQSIRMIRAHPDLEPTLGLGDAGEKKADVYQGE
jgi:hypothetical protein